MLENKSIVLNKLRAICVSLRCSPTRASNGSEKDVSRSVVLCPDCGHSLVWKRKPGAIRIHASSVNLHKRRSEPLSGRK